MRVNGFPKPDSSILPPSDRLLNDPELHARIREAGIKTAILFLVPIAAQYLNYLRAGRERRDKYFARPFILLERGPSRWPRRANYFNPGGIDGKGEFENQDPLPCALRTPA